MRVIRDESAVVAALKERFPKVRRENSYCLWSSEEAAVIAAANEALAPLLEEVKRSLPPFRERTGAPAEWAERHHCPVGYEVLLPAVPGADLPGKRGDGAGLHGALQVPGGAGGGLAGPATV